MKLYETLETQLKKEPNFVTDNGELKKWVVMSKAQNFDEELIALLLDNELLKEKFFKTMQLPDSKEVIIFNQNLFLQFLEQKNYLNDSYTRYKNKVGLTIDGKYLKQRNEVALVWPFKDCILEGGQSREEDKREEIFFNEVLAQDEITQLLELKVLTNAKRIDKDGEKPIDHFNRNENGTITDNLIIKGNNLLVLHTLKKEFAGKVKLIYIDPPYNTGNDGFKYNDNFNHSTWLTFMRNRLTIARELLRKDGAIFIQCDDNEQAYLKVLMDEVFGRDNFVVNIIPLMNPRGRQESAYPIAKSHEYILCYSKVVGNANFYNFGITQKDDIEDSFRLLSLRKSGNASLRSDRPNMFYPIYFNTKTNVISIDKTNDINEEEILPIKTNGIEGRWQKSNVANNANLLVCDRNSLNKYDIYVKDFLIKDGYYKGVKTNTFIIDTNIINDKANEHLESLFGIKRNFSYPKSEYLLQRIIEISTQSGDLVLDFHLGSGTTAAVAHKMGRQYIGIEQMDYIETVAVERLKKVIGKKTTSPKVETKEYELALVSESGAEYCKLDFDQGGISKSVNWQGGGSFVYFEIKKHNQTFIEQIEAAQSTEALLQIWEQMKAKSFFKFSIDLKAFDKSTEEFKQFTLEIQKETLLKTLDKNQLYVNLSSLNDGDFKCTEEEKRVTKEFYQIKR